MSREVSVSLAMSLVIGAASGVMAVLVARRWVWARGQGAVGLQWREILLFSTVVLVAGWLVSLPGAMARFDLQSRRTGMSTRLDELRVKNPECLSGTCDASVLSRIESVALGCIALQGTLKTLRYGGPCTMSASLVELSKFGLALEVFGAAPSRPDRWLVTPDAVYRLESVGE